MDHQQRRHRQGSPRGNAPGSGSGGASTSSGKHKGGSKGGGKKPIKVLYISNPMRVKTSAAGFRALVQELTGRHADPSKYSPEDLGGVGGAGADEEAAAVAGFDGVGQGISPGGAAASSDTVVASPGAAADHQPNANAAAAAPYGGYYYDDDGFSSELLENSYAVFSPPTLLYDHHPHSKGTKLSEAEVEQLMEAADADGNGTIDYEEFITATMHMNRMGREEHLYTAFQYFDKDNSGCISKEELEQALREKGLLDGRDIKDIISEVDADNDGRIDYSEFVAMMKKGNPEPNPKKRRDVVL